MSFISCCHVQQMSEWPRRGESP